MATKKATPAKKSAKSTSADAGTPKPAAKSAATKTPNNSAAKKTATPTEAKATTKKSASHDEIAKHAHKLWQQSGHHHGSHVEHWLRAEKELNG